MNNLRASYGTVSFLPSCVPDLSLYCFVVNLNTPVNTTSRLFDKSTSLKVIVLSINQSIQKVLTQTWPALYKKNNST